MFFGQLAEADVEAGVDVDGLVDGFNAAGAFTAMVLELEPGPAAMALLASIDPATLNFDERVEMLAAWERQLGWVQAQAQKTLVAVAGPAPVNADDWVREE